MGEKIRFGIIGCGGISAAHCRALRAMDGVELVAAADIASGALAQRTEEFGIPGRFSSWEDLLSRGGADAVCICVPHNLHHEIAVAACGAGKRKGQSIWSRRRGSP